MYSVSEDLEVLRSLRHNLQAQTGKAEDIMPSAAWRREAQQEEALSDPLPKYKKGPKLSADQHWNYFNGNSGKMSERHDGAHLWALLSSYYKS